MNDPFQRTDTTSAFVTCFHSDASQSSSSQSLSMTQNLPQNFLNKLREVHYVPYSTSNSLTIYSYVLWAKMNRVLVATKELNFKEIYFNHDTSPESRSRNGFESSVKIHKLQRSAENRQQATSAFVASIDIVECKNFSVFSATYVVVSFLLWSMGGSNSIGCEAVRFWIGSKRLFNTDRCVVGVWLVSKTIT